jgi:hypothetical protein
LAGAGESRLALSLKSPVAGRFGGWFRAERNVTNIPD